MTPELRRALVPKITMARMVSNYITHAITINTITLNLWLAAYAETLRLSGMAVGKGEE